VWDGLELLSAEHLLFTELLSAEHLLFTELLSAEHLLFTELLYAEHLLFTELLSAEHLLFTELLFAEHLLFTELLSTEHLLFTCHTRPHLALASFTKSESVSAQRTLTLEIIVQYKCRLSVKYFISVYSIILEQWLSKLSPLLPKCLRGIWEGKCVIKCVFLF